MIDWKLKPFIPTTSQPSIRTWYADTNQVKNLDAFKNEVRNFLKAANEKEPNVIHEVRFYD